MREFLRNNGGCGFGLKDFKGRPVIGVEGLHGSPGDDPNEELVSGFIGDGVD
jgi:hypothetical protein